MRSVFYIQDILVTFIATTFSMHVVGPSASITWLMLYIDEDGVKMGDKQFDKISIDYGYVLGKVLVIAMVKKSTFLCVGLDFES